MEQAKKGKGYVIKEYSDIGIVAPGYLKSPSDRYAIVNLSTIAESRVALEEYSLWIVWYSAEDVYFVIILNEIIGNVVDTKRLWPEVLAYDQDALLIFFGFCASCFHLLSQRVL